MGLKAGGKNNIFEDMFIFVITILFQSNVYKAQGSPLASKYLSSTSEEHKKNTIKCSEIFANLKGSLFSFHKDTHSQESRAQKLKFISQVQYNNNEYKKKSFSTQYMKVKKINRYLFYF